MLELWNFFIKHSLSKNFQLLLDTKNKPWTPSLIALTNESCFRIQILTFKIVPKHKQNR